MPSAFICQKKTQIGNHALPQRGFGLSTPSKAEREGATPSNTVRRQQRKSKRCTSPEANTPQPAGTAPSTTEARIKKTKAAITEHTASRLERGQPCRKKKRSKSQGTQCARTESASKESILSARRGSSRAGASGGLTGLPRGQWGRANHAKSATASTGFMAPLGRVLQANRNIAGSAD
jgi:hypothetical protein